MSRLAAAANAAQWIVGVGALAAILMLFTLDGAPEKDEAGLTTEISELVEDGRGLYDLRCASCHGAEGQGGQGPRLAGTVVINYPDAAEEIDLVTNGRGAMPPFALMLTEQEVIAVVAYTRFGFP